MEVSNKIPIKENNMARTSSGVYQLSDGMWGFRYAYMLNSKQSDLIMTFISFIFDSVLSTQIVQTPLFFLNAAGVMENLALNILLKWLKLENPRFSAISSAGLFVRIISLYAA